MMNDALNKLRAPAIALIVTGALNAVIGVLTILSGLLRLSGINGREALPVNEAEKFGFLVGTFIAYGGGALGLLAAPVIIYGAIQMLQGKKHGLAKTAAILAIVPLTSCCFLLGIPVGIWALIVLAKPEVKAVFQK